uniref:AlNc14C41G3510 protein n=1 Tax=Albugo laibachii Nc14 TaxID=890382 RepID=F0W9Q6_9STRA|nr:AlNc14C41G3510 [Albugo laibachii Nc14]|eukprot:CCA17874.1 AlNc14C41G3510 [Albugo laibachii Nc14]
MANEIFQIIKSHIIRQMTDVEKATKYGKGTKTLSTFSQTIANLARDDFEAATFDLFYLLQYYSHAFLGNSNTAKNSYWLKLQELSRKLGKVQALRSTSIPPTSEVSVSTASPPTLKGPKHETAILADWELLIPREHDAFIDDLQRDYKLLLEKIDQIPVFERGIPILPVN